MPIRLIKKSQGISRKISDTYKVMNFVTRDINKNVSLAVSTATRHAETTKSASDRIYYVLEGKLTVNKKYVAYMGDVIFIPKNTEYHFEGTFKTILVNAPAFNPRREQISKLKHS
jgi:ethanolamine utilization protein EutQ (cupin superfamily)